MKRDFQWNVPMIAVLVTSLAILIPADAAAAPAVSYTVADVIGRNPDDVCMLAYRSGHWSDWLQSDAAIHHASRTQRNAMTHYCDGFIHGLKFQGQ